MPSGDIWTIWAQNQKCPMECPDLRWVLHKKSTEFSLTVPHLHRGHCYAMLCNEQRFTNKHVPMTGADLNCIFNTWIKLFILTCCYTVEARNTSWKCEGHEDSCRSTHIWRGEMHQPTRSNGLSQKNTSQRSLGQGFPSCTGCLVIHFNLQNCSQWVSSSQHAIFSSEKQPHPNAQNIISSATVYFSISSYHILYHIHSYSYHSPNIPTSSVIIHHHPLFPKIINLQIETQSLSLSRYHCIYIYIWLLIKIPLSRNGHSSRIINCFRETFANSMFIFRGAHVGQQHLLWRFVHRLPNYARESRITSW